MPAKKEPNIQVEINPQWFRRLANISPTWSMEDTIKYIERLQSGGRTQMLIMLGEECLRQMKEQV